MTTYTVQTGDTPFEVAKRLSPRGASKKTILEASHRLRRVGGTLRRASSGGYLWVPGMVVTLD